jgi:iron(III) transport system substrate-binding protein
MRTPLVATVLSLAIVAAACADTDDSGGLEGSSLTVYSGRSEELVAPLIEQFEEESGVAVAVRYAGSSELAAAILEEGADSPADVFFAQDPASLGTVALAGLFAELPSEILDVVPERFRDTDGGWVGTSGRARVAVYDESIVDPTELPPDENGFTEPEWKGRVAIAPTNGSFLSFVSAKILLDGEEATLAWLEGMAANEAPTYPKNSAIVAAVDEGQVETGLVNHYYRYRRAAEEGDTVAVNFFFPTATAASLVMPAGAGILESAENDAAAEAFIAFLIGRGAQEYFAAETFEYPLLPGIDPYEGLPPLESITTPDIDLSQLATVLDRATDLVSEAGLL